MKLTPVEELKVKTEKFLEETLWYDGYTSALKEAIKFIKEAIAAEKQRVCTNCANSEAYSGIVDGVIHEGFYGINDCPIASGLDPNGYCHKFTPKESEAAT